MEFRFVDNDVFCTTCGKKLTRKNWYRLTGRKEYFCDLKCLQKWEDENLGVKPL